MKTILVTGATGNLGRAAVAALEKDGFTVRAASRHPEVVKNTIRFDYSDHTTYEDAINRVDGVLLVAPPLDVDAPQKLIPVIDACKFLGVRHIVFNSALGVYADEKSPFRIIERHLIDSGVGYTIIRPNFFTENFTSGFLAPMVKSGRISVAADNGRTSFISTTDIAAVVVAVLTAGPHNRSYNLTGPVSLTYAEAAAILSQALGQPVAYQPISEEEMVQAAMQDGLPLPDANYLAGLYRGVRNGWFDVVTEDVQQVTGRAPLSLAEAVGKQP